MTVTFFFFSRSSFDRFRDYWAVFGSVSILSLLIELSAAMTVFKKEKKVAESSAKSSGWFSKWIPENFTKKATEAFKLIERAMFSEEYIESGDSRKVKLLESQLKDLQGKVEHLLSTKTVTHSENHQQPQQPSAKKAPVTSQAQYNPQSQQVSVPLKPPAAAQAGWKPPPPAGAPPTSSSSSAKAVPPAPTRPLPFGASDLQVSRLPASNVRILNSSLQSLKLRSSAAAVPTPPAPPAQSKASFICLPQPVLHTHAPINISKAVPPTPAQRRVVLSFNSADLRRVKLGRKAEPAKTQVTPVSKPPAAFSLKSALKNAMRAKFQRAQGSPKGTEESDGDESDSEWNSK